MIHAHIYPVRVRRRSGRFRPGSEKNRIRTSGGCQRRVRGALEGMVVEDKLLSLAMKDGTATIDGVRYEGLYLLKMFLKQVLAIPRQASGKKR